MSQQTPDDSNIPTCALEYWHIFCNQVGKGSDVSERVVSFLSEYNAGILDFYLAAKFSGSPSLSYSLDCIAAMKRLVASEELYRQPYSSWEKLINLVAYQKPNGDFELHKLTNVSPSDQLSRHAQPPNLITSNGSVVLIGSKPLIAKCLAALSLLRERDPSTLFFVEKYIGAIIESPRSGMAVDWQPPTFQMAADVFESSITWCASCMGHEAHHSMLYQEFSMKHPGLAVPADYYSGKSVEIECLNRQRQVLKGIGAPASELDYLDRQDGSHAEAQ